MDSVPRRCEPPCDPNGEIWKPAPEPYASPYLVSNRGRVWSLHRHRGRTGCLLKPRFHNGGRNPAPKLAVTLYDGGGQKWTVEVHVLVMRAFVGPPPPGEEVRHLDGDAYRNWWPENLAYGTHWENCQDTMRHGRKGGKEGSAHPKAKLTEDLVRQLRSERATLRTTEQVLADRHDVNVATMHKLLVGKTWRHVA